MTETMLGAIGGGDAQAIIDNAIVSVPPRNLDPERIYQLIVPAGARNEIIDLEALLDHPRRKQGRVTHHTGASLAAYVNEHADTSPGGATRLYADVYERRIVGVLNGHEIDEGDAGWGDHRAVLTLRATPEWERWVARDAKMLGQVDFAEHVEESLADIREPDGATLLELAKTFEAKTNIQFRSATVLESGERQLTYVEQIDARAGVSGEIVIPKELVLGLAPFEGCDPYKITARLRYRITDGRLAIGYQLIRAEDVQRQAFDDTLTAIETLTELTAFRGVPA